MAVSNPRNCNLKFYILKVPEGEENCFGMPFTFRQRASKREEAKDRHGAFTLLSVPGCSWPKVWAFQKSYSARSPPLSMPLTLPSSTHKLTSLPPALLHPHPLAALRLSRASLVPALSTADKAFDPVCRWAGFICCPRGSGPWLAVPLLAITET